MEAIMVKLIWPSRSFFNSFIPCLLIYTIIPDVSIACKEITRYWRPMKVDVRTELANIVVSGVVVRTFNNHENSKKAYAAEVYFDEIYKGVIPIKNATLVNKAPPTYRVENFGDERYCLSPVIPGGHYIFFLKAIASPGVRPQDGGIRLYARYDDPSGAVIDFDYNTEAKVLKTIGWRTWSQWTPCTADCEGGVRSRRRICVLDFADACEGKALQIQDCNKFECEGNKDLIELLSISTLPRGVTALPYRPSGYRIDRSAILRMKTYDLFGSTFPTSLSIIMEIRPRLSSDGRLYVLQMVDSSGILQLGIRIGDNPALMYSQKVGQIRKEISLSFPVNMLDRRWHKLAFSIKGSNVVLHSDCAYVYSGEMEIDTLAIDPEGTTSVGSATSSSRDMYYEGDIEQLIISNDANAAALHCPRDNRSIPSMFDKIIYPQVSDEGNGEESTTVQPVPSLTTKALQTRSKTEKESIPRATYKEKTYTHKNPELITTKRPANTRYMLTSYFKPNINITPKKIVEVLEAYEPTEAPPTLTAVRDTDVAVMEEEDSSSNLSFDNIFEDNQNKLGDLFPSDITASRGPANFIGFDARRGDIADFASGDGEENFRWSSWTYCSKTCGGGESQRVGFCYSSSTNSVCLENGPGSVIERQTCNSQACPDPCYPGCKNDGRCNYHTGTCLCNIGFSGQYCEQNLCDEPCRFGGRCVAKNHCSCPYGFLPPFCRPVCDPPCYNDGECVYKDQCSCKQGWKGPNCLTPICKDYCLNGGRCVGPDHCTCRSGYTGDNCETPICRPACENGGECVSPYFCKCKPGTKGQRCHITYCERFCRNGGKCIGANKCSCPRGYSGQFCHIQMSIQPAPALSATNQQASSNRRVGYTGLTGRSRYYQARGRTAPCRYESYVMSFQRGYAHKVQRTFEEDCGPWTTRKCTRTKFVYEYVYKQFYRTAYRCIQPS
ncbi:uncharacterized protein LOC117102011 isoform X2 [Anneissia japonica]|uniref:uncharacterized protein LOC117102011 isoform X2 n=1 Tax=Anneissia japonica TaxID=1529436 RepID=UPI001425740A|nr:uncharacterized protein LOC117102011 isoform X2 [Anneissia japonica]